MMVWTEAQKSALFIINSDFAANIQLFFETTKMSLLFGGGMFYWSVFQMLCENFRNEIFRNVFM